ncbi:NAD/NADP-dependent octopine/nopaline dehydrogenase family protein [Acidaminobacter hydrogenoformans]|uniref:Opine dehydrogenase n=1 Tax=Acidaminobacter hydrogenoformans DSM 2784 TaxID=1120920 RepID=A0A1G5S1G2_9FIRM|nr:NAD/NADP-dependent octopine/nopaline dehydrogenase family protein [Acidaminobacter hydrogenoformans]SCZ80204.1 opine dehydrogenase [Acidaminobacter hydrogenoformans DSM 2784]
MKITVIGAGNSGMAMAAHLSKEGHQVTIWNRSRRSIEKLIKTHSIRSSGIISGNFSVHCVTDVISEALKDPDIVLVTTPANSHRALAELIAKNINKSTAIVLNPGRTFGALEFKAIYEKFNKTHEQIVAETQTIIYTCRKTDEDAVNIIAFKESVLIASLDLPSNLEIFDYLPECLHKYFTPAHSMIQTSIGNVGMVLHCAPLLLNTGWTESKKNIYKYYYDGITPTIGKFIEKIDLERVRVSEALGYKVESTREWMIRTYHVTGNTLYDCIQANEAYKTIEAPGSLEHRYIFEDVPCGLVPLEAIGLKLGLDMNHTTLIIDLATKLLCVDFRKNGRNLAHLDISSINDGFKENLKEALL